MINLKTEHLHVWTRTLDGSELGNAVYNDDVDAATNFLAIARLLTNHNPESDIKIEDVMLSLTEGRGMYAGIPGLIVVVSRCNGRCNSPVWN